MFDGYLPRRSTRARIGRGGVVLLSSIVHGMLVVGVMTVSAHVGESEVLHEVPVLFYAPPPPPPPPPPPAVRQKPVRTRREQPVERTIVQPRVDEIKPVELEPEPEPQPESEPEETAVEDVEGGQAGGVVGGVTGGEVGGQIGGQVGGTIGGQLSDDPVPLRRGMVPPRVIAATRVKPIYPRALREAGISGRVLLVLEVRRDGSVGRVQVRSGHPVLAEAARAAVLRWRFVPAQLAGKPVAVWMPYPIVFKLER